MGIVNIAPAQRAGAHLLIQLYGPPRSGKTYTALRITRGMVGKGRRSSRERYRLPRFRCPMLPLSIASAACVDTKAPFFLRTRFLIGREDTTFYSITNRGTS